MYTQSKSVLLLLAIFICMLNQCLGQKIKTLKLGEQIKGRMEIDESHEYFEMNVTGLKEDTVLVFETQENKEDLEEKADEVFSDPDFYISKINKYPSSKKSSEWYSERYGTDVLAIPSESLSEGETLYIGMYCQFKCRYHFRTYFTTEFPLSLNSFHFINIKAHETMNYKIYVEEEFEELNLVAYSKNGGKFRIFMNKVSPSSQNTFNVIPSWTNGYSIQVQKSNEHQYCTKCNYYVLVQNEGSEDINTLLIYVMLNGKIVSLPPEMPLYDAMNKNSKRCYSFNMTNEEKSQDNLIIQTTMYSGSVALQIKGWEKPDDSSQTLGNSNEYVYKIVTEHFIILTKKDFDKFDSQNPQFSGKPSTLYFCLYSSPESSFTISSYFLTKLGKLQSVEPTSILIPGNKVRNYLLKDQVMVYELTGHNLEKVRYDIKTNITISTIDLLGTTKSYIYFCQKENCTVDKTKIDEYISNKLIKPIEKTDFETYEILLTNEDNECYKKPNITLENGNIINCQTLALIYCETPNQEGICAFDVQHTVQDDPLLMTPKKIYYGSIPLGKTDYYNIVINDKNIHSLVVVLNSESGDAELSLFKKTEDGNLNSKEGRLVGVSYHNDYIPDVVRLTPAKLNREDIVGDYLIKVTPTTFSSYYIYYYVLYNKDPNENKDEPKNLPEVTLNLEMGEVITDYFPNDIRYKIYSFTPFTDDKTNIKIFIDRVNVDFNIYVFKDFSTFKILPFYEVSKKKDEEIITGYDWRDEGDNEITILGNDPEFDPTKMHYIVISPNIPEINNPDLLHSAPNEGREEIIEKKAAIQFYLGLTEAEEEITISEGIPHTMTLDSEYSEQVYYYEHTDITKDFELEINVYSGEIDVYIDVNQITLDRVQNLDGEEELNIDGTMYYKLGIIDAFDSIVIPSDYFKTQISQEEEDEDLGIGLYFLIKRSNSSVEDDVECKYSIVEFSSEETAELLQPGLTISSSLVPGEKAFYVIEEVKRRKGSAITVTFSGGVGNVFVRIPEVPEDDMVFPSFENYQYMGESMFTSKIVTIPEEEFKKIDEENFKLQILVTVEVYDSNEEPDPDDELQLIDSDVSFTISYSNEPKSISQNEPYDGFIQKGELQYFNLYFDETTENIYIGLSNMNGDADMYLNYGDTLPSPTSSDWKANQANHEYIDINKNDKYFKTNNEEISGYYTLLITGFIDTSYTLFISTHKELVLPLRNNRPASCNCESDGEKCYFRYNEVFDTENKKKGILHNDIVFTAKYFYGSGIMYAKVVKDFELNGKDFYKYFPTDTDYDMSNKESKQRNYMKMQIQGSQYTEDASVLMTFVCQVKTKVDIMPTILRHYNTIDYIGENKENTFYLGYDEISGEKPELELYFTNFETEQDLVYSLHSYIGEAHVKVYSNDSRYDINTQSMTYDYVEFMDFEINSMNYSDQGIDVYNPYSEDYHGFIPIEAHENVEYIIFKITPKSEFGFYIRCNYDKNWNYIPIGSSKSYYARHHEFFGFFDITNEFTDVDINLNVEDNLFMSADLYIKINVIDTTKKREIKGNEEISEFSLYDYSFPSEKSYDYVSSTDKILGSLSLKIKDLPKLTEEESQFKFVRALIYARIYPSDFEPIEDEDEEDIGRMKKHHREWEMERGDDFQELIDILITPGTNNIKYINANPLEYYFNNLTYEKGPVKVPEKQIYMLKKQVPTDEVLIIEISACVGKFKFELHDKLIMYNETAPEEKSIKYQERDIHGKKIIYVDNISSEIYYLTIIPVESDFICRMKNFGLRNQQPCNNDLTYLMHYYTDKKQFLKFTQIKIKTIYPEPYGRGKVKIPLPKIITTSIEKNTTDIYDYRFDVFLSRDEDDYDKMGSVCYLCKYNNSKVDSKIFRVKDIKIKNNKFLIVGGLGYRKSYYMTLLIQNTKTKELMTFHPNAGWSGGFLPFALWQTGLGNLVIIVLVVSLVIVCRKYCGAKEELKEIKGDTLPKTESELSNNTGEKVKYSGLGESY